LPPDIVRSVSRGYYAGGGTEEYGIQNQVYFAPVFTSLNITPIITQDKKNVLLNITTMMQDFLEFKTHEVAAILATPGEAGGQGGQTIVPMPVTVPEMETSQVMTRVSVPDGGTLLLGGQKISAEIEKEVGVPILSKIPVVGILFGSRSKIRDNKILLILVKPTIILQDEREAEAIAALER
jgi:type II secretory pathway component GspD/PulD (secretin)